MFFNINLEIIDETKSPGGGLKIAIKIESGQIILVTVDLPRSGKKNEFLKVLDTFSFHYFFNI